MSQEVRREVEEALLTKDKKIGASVLTLAKNLYTSNARFVFELLQNADDNQYHTAREDGDSPFVCFKVYPDKIVVDCNEDGFTERNLRAICDVGNSSKTGSQGYIGEKGIGFKSVFMAAWKVHIQSGPFSFSFTHRQGDSGMGMVKPTWEETSEELPRPLTRMTLFLQEGEDDAESKRKRERIEQEFRDLQAQLLLFLRNLRRISVYVYDEQDCQIWSRVLTMRDAKEANRVLLDTDSSGDPTVVSETRAYHITKYTATDLSKNENRSLSAAEQASKSYTKSEIILAFPLTADSEPIIEHQKVFAFLPMRQMGFNFIIQADFVTQASREDVVTDSPRNRGDENPLFEDLNPELYMSDSYSESDIKILRQVGLRPLDAGDAIVLAKQDLASSSSRMKNPGTEIDWHRRVAWLLNSLFRQDFGEKEFVRQLDLIPLVDGSWARAVDGELFFSHAGGVPIPRDLGLRLVQPDAAEDTERRSLFDHLKVQSPEVRNVRTMILRLYGPSCSYMPFAKSMEHLRFLYLTHGAGDHTGLLGFRLFELQIHDSSSEMRMPSLSTVYVHGDKPYGAENLLGHDGAQQLGVYFLNRNYFNDPPKQSSSTKLTWLDWMHEYVGIRRHVQLIDSRTNRLSEECKYIAEHRPEMFLGYLRQAWLKEEIIVTSNESALQALQQIEVLCLSGKKVPLSNAYLPLPKLREACSRYIRVEEFPFLQLPNPIDEANLLLDWTFLTNKLGVGPEADLEFRLRLLSCIQESVNDPLAGDMPLRITDLYQYIKNACTESQQPKPLQDRTRRFFEEEAAIWISYSHGEYMGQTEWVSPSECLWDAPDNMVSMKPLKPLYQAALAGTRLDMDELEGFFRKVLQVQDLTYAHIIDEIMALRRKYKHAVDLQYLRQLYEKLHQFVEGYEVDRNQIRQVFRNYGDLQEFFVTVLGVQTVDLTMVYDSLVDTEFVIADRQQPFSILSDQVKRLDFTLMECVEESSRVEEGLETVIKDRRYDIKMRAYGLLRVAAKYNSPRYDADAQGLYDLLRETVTVETDGISSRLILKQDDKTYEHEISKSELHIEHSVDQLKVYVPRNEVDRQSCFLVTLPRHLVYWLMKRPGVSSAYTVDESAVNDVISVLNCPVSIIPSILTKKGVPEIHIPEVDIPDLSGEHGSAAVLPVTPTRRSRSSPLLQQGASPSSDVSAPRTVSSPGETPNYPTPLTDPEIYSDDGPDPTTPVYPRPPPMTSRVEVESQYRRFLEKIVRVARRAVFPDHGYSGLTSSLGNLSIGDDEYDGASVVPYLSEWERRVKIGAAGELFVFELLSSLQPNLPGFGRGNWQSLIRQYVNVHPDYKDLPGFQEKETSDIVYHDASGALTTLLIQKGYLSGNRWTGKTPRYYIEVKSTTDLCATPFFISGNQYALMQSATNGPSDTGSQDEIYTIFRVFNLGKESMGVMVHVDAEEQRRMGILTFTTDHYTVVPGPRYRDL
ncbi:hypothetical protein DL766_000105 [Monosporascus sp. MC13-8B]|uniref:Protein NO VEIN C-terminal domain-containing protein n=1 Tax=Monosporascus cannonballus TaxID=155416 RepID=A0ABY0H5W6_9PEZI|nr:hypothetical protein DL762_005272 [Monosporascus cannonballus]RYO90427.1 hypothetical protein DL763_005347 [Monosporascus cannonballus]RYP40081.1 hypothetical protein DL766_000105 [Monosporascus sp. MC13-8B]